MTTTVHARPAHGNADAYASFLLGKAQNDTRAGFRPLWLPSFLKDFQGALVEWAVEMGRAALLEDCGLGKTIQQLVWAENVVRHTNGRVLVLTPLAVAAQTVAEAQKFGVEARLLRDGRLGSPVEVIPESSKMNVLHRFANFFRPSAREGSAHSGQANRSPMSLALDVWF